MMRTIHHHIDDNFSILIQRHTNGDLKLSCGSYPVDWNDRIVCTWRQLSLTGELHASEDFLRWSYSEKYGDFDRILEGMNKAISDDWNQWHDNRLNQWRK